MGRKKLKLHELTLRERRGRAVCWWHGREWWFGPWDAAAGGPSAEAREAFARQAAAWAADPAAGLRADDYLVATLCREWLLSADSPAAGSRAAAAVRESLAWVCRLHAATTAADFTAAAFRAWQDWLCDQVGPVSGKRLRRKTIAGHRAAVLRAVRFAASAGRVPASRPAELAAVPPPRKGRGLPSERRRPVAGRVVKATLPFLPAQVAEAVRLLWLTGARPDELLRLTAGDIVRSGWVETPFDVRLNLDRWKGRVWAAVLVEHKTDEVSDRVLFFGPRAQRALLPILERCGPADHLFDPRAATREKCDRDRAKRKPGNTGSRKPVKGAAAKRKPGSRYTASGLRNAVKRGAERAGVPHWYPRQLRQAFARRLVARGVGQAAAGCCLGHAGVGVTFRYTDRDLVTAAKVFAKWG